MSRIFWEHYEKIPENLRSTQEKKVENKRGDGKVDPEEEKFIKTPISPTVKLHRETCLDAASSVGMYLLFENPYSPLSCSPLHSRALWDLDSPELEFLSLDAPCNGTDPYLHKFCTNSEFRFEVLSCFYPEVDPLSHLRVKCALSMAQFICNSNQLKAESLLYEAIFLLDKIGVDPIFGPAIWSELGSSCLIWYGDILLSNKKYKYGLAALEAAMSCFDIRNTPQEKRRIERNLCDVCTKNNDWNSATKYLQLVLNQNGRDQNINEYVFVSSKISTSYSSIGDFYNAERALLQALSVIREWSIKESSNLLVTKHELFHALYELFMELAKLYLKGNRLSEAQSLLTSIEQAHELTKYRKTKKAAVRLLLAKSLLKGRLYDQAQKILNQMDETKQNPPSDSETSGLSGMSGTGVSSSSTRSKHGINPRKLYSLRSQLFLAFKKFQEALTTVNMAIKDCAPHEYQRKGKFYELKGDIEHSSNLTFLKTKEQPFSVGDLPSPQVPAKSYSAALENYRIVTDDVGIGRVQSKVCCCYLELYMTATRGDALTTSKMCGKNTFFTKNISSEEDEKKDEVKDVVDAPAESAEPDADPKPQAAKIKMIDVPPESMSALTSMAQSSLRTFTKILDIVGLLNAFLNNSEAFFLYDRLEASINFWQESVTIFYSTFIVNDECTVVVPTFHHGRYHDPRLSKYVQRAVRMLFLFPFDAERLAKNAKLVTILKNIAITTQKSPFNELVYSAPSSPARGLREQRVNRHVRGWKGRGAGQAFRRNSGMYEDPFARNISLPHVNGYLALFDKLVAKFSPSDQGNHARLTLRSLQLPRIIKGYISEARNAFLETVPDKNVQHIGFIGNASPARAYRELVQIVSKLASLSPVTCGENSDKTPLDPNTFGLKGDSAFAQFEISFAVMPTKLILYSHHIGLVAWKYNKFFNDNVYEREFLHDFVQRLLSTIIPKHDEMLVGNKQPRMRLASLRELYFNLDPDNIYKVLLCLALGHPIVLGSSDRMKIISVIDALGALIFPYPCAPLVVLDLPLALLHMLSFKEPYIFGLRLRILDGLKSFELPKNALIVRLDSNHVSHTFEEKPPFEETIVMKSAAKLRKCSMAFLSRMNVLLRQKHISENLRPGTINMAYNIPYRATYFRAYDQETHERRGQRYFLPHRDLTLFGEYHMITRMFDFYHSPVTPEMENEISRLRMEYSDYFASLKYRLKEKHS